MGCLSVPDLEGKLPALVHARAPSRPTGRDGEGLDFDARASTPGVVQHEGRPPRRLRVPGRMRSLETLTFLPEFKRYWMTRRGSLPDRAPARARRAPGSPR